ncbi:MAG: caspase family protein [Epsilonproteobacteria bacterium]|nr:caspase family protein [Campylobacterota bacterium]
MKYFIFLLISTLYFIAYADDRAVKIVDNSKNVEQRVALVIGNSDYRGVLSKLSNTINDAKSIKNILEQRGFEVIYSEDTTKKNMKKSLVMIVMEIPNR